MSDALGDAVLSWLHQHPYTGEPVTQTEIISFRNNPDGTIELDSAAPAILGITIDLLDTALDEYVTFHDGVITLNVQPEPLHYQVLYGGGNVVMCQRIGASS